MSKFLDRMPDFSALPFVSSARVWLVGALGILLLISLLMVASASIPFAINHPDMEDLKFFWSQLAYMGVAIVVGFLIYQIPLKHYYKKNTRRAIFALALILLAATIAFSPSINGAKRWLSIFGFSFQPAEFAKVFLVLVVANYITTSPEEVRHSGILASGGKLLPWYLPVIFLLILQPDYGSAVVIGATLLVMFFVGGVSLRQYVLLILSALALAALGLVSADYRMSRLLSFRNPFDDVLGDGYQLSRSLAAFAHGEWTGVGYGNSIYKLEHLPEAHTDFLLAITGEELGFLGVLMVLLLEFIIIGALLRISYKCLKLRQLRLTYSVFGFAVMIFGQVFINAGMNMGILPTKGLTLPFYSYGGSSMLFSIIMVAIALKIDAQSPIIDKNGNNRDY